MGDVRAADYFRHPGMRILYVGNRIFALQELRAAGLVPERILVRPGSPLESELEAEGTPFALLGSKQELLDELERERYDLFISSGCHHVLPVGSLTHLGTRFINVHPSPLPDLRGKSAMAGAHLFGRDIGAACHVMDDGIDTGGVIAQERVPITDDADTGLLYALCWLSERRVVREAIARDFKPRTAGGKGVGTIYFAHRPEDLQLDWSAGAEDVYRRIRAFGVPTKGAWFMHRGEKVVVRGVQRVTNPYAMTYHAALRENEVLCTYENKLLVKKGEAFLNLREIEAPPGCITAGDILGNG